MPKAIKDKKITEGKFLPLTDDYIEMRNLPSEEAFINSDYRRKFVDAYNRKLQKFWDHLRVIEKENKELKTEVLKLKALVKQWSNLHGFKSEDFIAVGKGALVRNKML